MEYDRLTRGSNFEVLKRGSRLSSIDAMVVEAMCWRKKDSGIVAVDEKDENEGRNSGRVVKTLPWLR